ncbi:SPFH domain-containing protein [Microbulbifer sp. OS29]|uniref:SPFH domain-containing protein n=1 Tax=Microbulbifer okhotskensis TaxID=2926617 RepID=A0A9X2EP46_9GAMM|nr:flotillin domain-containing protein [Microbulbifer okhotskensis]MCO1333006.1 SPFH domain-containing protein [Microbulbifer okhotskensis]
MENLAVIGNLPVIVFIAGAVLVALIVTGTIFARLYTRASKERSFVRTGMGGQKVIMNGGALVLPVLHEIIAVNMNTLRLAVSRKEHLALITKDRMRVDVLAEFYLRVKPDIDAIANAAQTLGLRTLDPDALKEMIEGKFVDALRSVAAEMEMAELHEQRSQFVQKVQQVVSEDLLKNGLELEAVSLTGLDQTHKEFFNQDNVFDAEGLASMTRSIEARRKEVNDVEQETMVQIETKNLEAERQKLEIDKEKRYAHLEQQRELENREAAQKADIARELAEQERAARKAEIEAQREVSQSQIAAEQATKLLEIEKERRLEEQEIERARILDEQRISKQKSVEIAEQERAIAVAEKSKEQSLADQQANVALAEAVKAEEQVRTAKDVEVAERDKRIEIIEAQKVAERQATGIKVMAEAEKSAAEDKAEALRLQASAEAEAIRIKVEADREKYAVDAEGQRLMNEAYNSLNEAQIALKQVLSLHENLPNIIRESVKPMERIEGMKIISVEGLNGVDGRASTGILDGDAEARSQSLPEALVGSALKHRAMAPLVDSLLKEAGVGNLNTSVETEK